MDEHHEDFDKALIERINRNIEAASKDEPMFAAIMFCSTYALYCREVGMSDSGAVDMLRGFLDENPKEETTSLKN